MNKEDDYVLCSKCETNPCECMTKEKRFNIIKCKVCNKEFELSEHIKLALNQEVESALKQQREDYEKIISKLKDDKRPQGTKK